MKRFIVVAGIVMLLAYVVGAARERDVQRHGMTARESHRVHQERQNTRMRQQLTDDLGDMLRRIR